jgi:hypothetical protein
MACRPDVQEDRSASFHFLVLLGDSRTLSERLSFCLISLIGSTLNFVATDGSTSHTRLISMAQALLQPVRVAPEASPLLDGSADCPASAFPACPATCSNSSHNTGSDARFFAGRRLAERPTGPRGSRCAAKYACSRRLPVRSCPQKNRGRRPLPARPHPQTVETQSTAALGAVRTPRHLCDGHRSGSATAASKRSDRRAR